MTSKTKQPAKAPKPNANERALLHRVERIVSKYAKADAAFFADVTTFARECGPVTDKQWTAAYAPAFRAAFDKHAPAVRDVMVNRAKIVFLCAANGITPTGPDGEAITSLRPAAEAGRQLLADAKILPPVGTGKGAGKKKGATGKRVAAKAANSNAGVINRAALKPGTLYSQEELRGAALVLTGSPKLATELAALLASDRDARPDFAKVLRVFVDGRKSCTDGRVRLVIR